MRSLATRSVAPWVVALTFISACQTSTTTLPSVAANTTTDTLNIVVPGPINGVAQMSFGSFNVTASGAALLVLSSAVETFANNAGVNPNVVVGIALGTVSADGSTCVLNTAVLPLQASANQNQTGQLPVGKNCVQVSNLDTSAVAGPVAATVIITHT